MGLPRKRFVVGSMAVFVFCVAGFVIPKLTTDQYGELESRNDSGSAAVRFARSLHSPAVDTTLGYRLERTSSPPSPDDGGNCTGTNNAWIVTEYGWWYLHSLPLVACDP